MSLNMKLDEFVCPCCGRKQKVEIGKYQMSQLEFLDLQEYFDFKFVNLIVCDNCGYASTNTTDSVSSEIKKLITSKSYKTVLNCNYLEKFKDLPFDEYEQFKNGDAEALSLIWEKEGKLGIEYAKLQSWIYEMKTAMRKICYENVADIGDEKFKDSYWQLIHILSEQMHTHMEKCMKALSQVEIKNPYEAIFTAECLTRCNDFNLAKNMIEKVKSSFELDEDLNKYIEQFLTKVEII